MNFGRATAWSQEERQAFAVYVVGESGRGSAAVLSTLLFGASPRSRMCYLSRRERNRLKHAENGNPPQKAARTGRRGATAQEVEAQVARLVAWCAEHGRLPRQRGDDLPERQLARWLNNFQLRGIAAAATDRQRQAVRDCLARWGLSLSRAPPPIYGPVRTLPI